MLLAVLTESCLILKPMQIEKHKLIINVQQRNNKYFIYRSANQNNSYCVELAVEDSFKHDWVQATYGENVDAIRKPKLRELFGDDTSGHSTVDDKDINHDTFDHQHNNYEFDLHIGLHCHNYSHNKEYQYYWRQFKLKRRNDNELLNDLKQIYTNYLYECKDTQQKQKLDIMDNKLENKYNHPTHVKMGYPLSRACLYAIILHTDTHLHTSVTTSQKEGNLAKYIVFDYCLYWAITTLNEFNKIESSGDSKKDKQITQIYSGVCAFRNCKYLFFSFFGFFGFFGFLVFWFFICVVFIRKSKIQ